MQNSFYSCYTSIHRVIHMCQTWALTGIKADRAAFSVETYGIGAISLRTYNLFALCNGGLFREEGEMEQD